MSFVIRPARAADVDGILAIESSWATTPHWTRGQFIDELKNARSVFLVAEEELGARKEITTPAIIPLRALAGYAAAWVVEEELQILSVAVHPEHARKGAGRGLVDALCAAGARRGCRRATLEVSHLNLAALALYRGCGFVVVGRRPKFYNDGSDAVLMDKTLP